MALVMAVMVCLLPVAKGGDAPDAYMNIGGPDTLVYKTNTGSRFHRPGCFYLSQSRIATTLAEALASGLSPCSYCRPGAGIEFYPDGAVLAW